MPQLDFSTFAPQLAWLVITFVALYLFLGRVALPRIGGIIEQRRDRIADDLDEAARFKAQTDDAIAAYEASLATAKAKASGIAQETRDALGAETDKERIKVEDMLGEKARQAEERIAKTKKQAVANIKEVAAETAQAVVQKLIGAKVTKISAIASVTGVMGK
jgi:F-type H+-transporting ATPase subunit b